MSAKPSREPSRVTRSGSALLAQPESLLTTDQPAAPQLGELAPALGPTAPVLVSTATSPAAGPPAVIPDITGASLADYATPPSSLPSPSAPHVPTTPSCPHPTVSGANFCGQCGIPMRAPITTTTVSPTDTTASTHTVSPPVTCPLPYLIPSGMPSVPPTGYTPHVSLAHVGCHVIHFEVLGVRGKKTPIYHRGRDMARPTLHRLLTAADKLRDTATSNDIYSNFSLYIILGDYIGNNFNVSMASDEPTSTISFTDSVNKSILTLQSLSDPDTPLSFRLVAAALPLKVADVTYAAALDRARPTPTPPTSHAGQTMAQHISNVTSPQNTLPLYNPCTGTCPNCGPDTPYHSVPCSHCNWDTTVDPVCTGCTLKACTGSCRACKASTGPHRPCTWCMPGECKPVDARRLKRQIPLFYSTPSVEDPPPVLIAPPPPPTQPLTSTTHATHPDPPSHLTFTYAPPSPSPPSPTPSTSLSQFSQPPISLPPPHLTGNLYAVAVGHRPGIYGSWAEASVHVNGYKSALHQRFHYPTTSMAEIDAWLYQYRETPTHRHTKRPRAPSSPTPSRPRPPPIDISPHRIPPALRPHNTQPTPSPPPCTPHCPAIFTGSHKNNCHVCGHHRPKTSPPSAPKTRTRATQQPNPTPDSSQTPLSTLHPAHPPTTSPLPSTIMDTLRASSRAPPTSPLIAPTTTTTLLHDTSASESEYLQLRTDFPGYGLPIFPALRDGYSTTPSMASITAGFTTDRSPTASWRTAHSLTISHPYGSITWPTPTPISNLNLSTSVLITTDSISIRGPSPFSPAPAALSKPANITIRNAKPEPTTGTDLPPISLSSATSRFQSSLSLQGATNIRLVDDDCGNWTLTYTQPFPTGGSSR